MRIASPLMIQPNPSVVSPRPFANVRFGAQEPTDQVQLSTDLTPWLGESDQVFEKRAADFAKLPFDRFNWVAIKTPEPTETPGSLSRLTNTMKWPVNVGNAIVDIPKSLYHLAFYRGGSLRESPSTFFPLAFFSTIAIVRNLPNILWNANEMAAAKKQSEQGYAERNFIDKRFKELLSPPKDLARQGKIDEAFKQFAKALELPALDVRAFQTYRALGDFAFDLLAVTAGKSRYPNPDIDTDLRANTALVEKLKPLPLQPIALKAYERASQLAPTIHYTLMDMAEVHDFMGNGDKAIEYQQKAYDTARREQGNNHTTTGSLLAHTLAKYGHVDKAITLRKDLLAQEAAITHTRPYLSYSGEVHSLLKLYTKQAEQLPDVQNKNDYAIHQMMGTFQELLPQYPDLERQYANFCYQHGRTDLAHPLYRKMLDSELKKQDAADIMEVYFLLQCLNEPFTQQQSRRFESAALLQLLQAESNKPGTPALRTQQLQGLIQQWNVKA